ncbi:serine O-acetyltransferase [Criibacterium bergeronii]|uniref:Serine acetyltransferase n=1 Tax=Criibacterium bergeronii TaxID=1871336 RepID=A0A371IKN0_9FIRM|nr:serine O-acetyltransferase [Criibacterium bergeronii]MBS6063496.1 serine acetyltransferase [Peptostreptococcaceae bacterium]RDY21045.1 serine acetyltransferase [Criibacterium bergeronii]TRW28356.1 serine acetyltransferase [Criibacterium bergeronii]
MDIKGQIAVVANQLEENYKKQGIFEIEIGQKFPKRSEVIDIINESRRIIFPGFFGSENTAYINLNHFASLVLSNVYEKLFKQIRVAFMFAKRGENLTNIDSEAEKIASQFIEQIPRIQNTIFKDVEAMLDGDPAAGSKEDVIFSYPGIYALFVYRLAHILYKLDVPYIPRIMTEHAHSKTGIDINPGAQIGEYIAIDHGTGIVIGETTIIGDHVKIYQGVTLGALSTMKGQALSGIKRHPTIEDYVVIYANATILGGNTIIGKNSVIAGNTFVTESVPENSKVSSNIPEINLTQVCKNYKA